MRLQPAQVNPVTKVIGGDPVTYWDRRLLMHAGYRYFDAIMVGGSGGYGGRSYKNSGLYSYGAGPGGGGCLRIRGKLTDLTSDATLIGAGSVGANGSDQTTPTAGGTGGTGGTSNFYAWQAFGGKGGGGGDTSYSASLGDSYTISDGGDGGDNSLGLGSPGVGSEGGLDSTAPNHTAATSGVYAVSGGNGGGGGGGGESGKADSASSASPYAGAAGKTGNVYTPDNITGIAGLVTSNKGGAGGGANISDVTGGPNEYYGGYAAGSEPKGVVYVKAHVTDPAV